MVGTWAQEKVKEKLAKSLHIVRLNLYKAFEYIYLSKNKSTSDWIVPAVSAAQSGSMFPVGTTLQSLNWTFYLSVLNSAPGSWSPAQHQPSHPTWTMSELFPAACRCEGGIKYLPLFAASGSNYVEFELCCAELSRWQLGTSPQKVPEDFTITEKARALSWLKVPTSASTFKTLLRYYAKHGK